MNRIKLLVVFLLMSSFCLVSVDVFADEQVTIWAPTGSINYSNIGSSGNCDVNDNNYYRIDCAGVSWAYYEYVGSGETSPELPYAFGTKLDKVNSGCAKKIGNTYGGFWHFGINAFGATYVGGGTDVATDIDSYSVYNGHWATLGYNSSSEYNSEYNIAPSGITPENYDAQMIGGYRFVRRGTIKNVLADYRKIPGKSGASIPPGTYAFCYNRYYDNPSQDDDPQSSTPETVLPSFYSESHVAIKDGEYNYTGICKENGVDCKKPVNKSYFENVDADLKGVVTVKDTLNKGEGTDLTFAHNLFSSDRYVSSNSSGYSTWAIYRTVKKNGFLYNVYDKEGNRIENFLAGNKGDYNISWVRKESEETKCGTIGKKPGEFTVTYGDKKCYYSYPYSYGFNNGFVSGVTEPPSFAHITFTRIGNKKYDINNNNSWRDNPELYVNNPRYFTDGGDNYFLNRDVYSVTFNKTGTYTFCEKLLFMRDGVVNNKIQMTTACAEITVVEPDEPGPDEPEPDEPEPELSFYEFKGEAYDVNGELLEDIDNIVKSNLESGSRVTFYQKEFGVDESKYTFKGWVYGCAGYSNDYPKCIRNTVKNNNYFNTTSSSSWAYVEGNNWNNWKFIVKQIKTNIRVFAVYEKKEEFSKKPSIQIWGGSMYTNGNIDLLYTTKNIDGSEKFFGSWVEQGILRADGTLSGVGSGASMGYNKDISKAGGKKNSSCGGVVLCISPLTITNEKKDEYTLKESSINAKPSASERIKLIDVGYEVKELPNKSYGINLVDDDKIIQDVDESIVVKSGTNIFKVNGDFLIANDIKYSDEGYTTFSTIPKLIIYADNINILCGVKRVDAVLIAEGTVNTCTMYDGTSNIDVNSGSRSNQLKINGSIIANRLVAGRTYGAGTGIYSVIPAEIIDYDSSLYLWSLNGKSFYDPGTGEVNSGALNTAYLKELAPRL